MTESPRRNILEMNLSLFTGLAFFFPEENIVFNKLTYPVLHYIYRLHHIEQHITFARLWQLGPHLLDSLQHHVAVPVEGLHAAEQLLVIPELAMSLQAEQ
jgi:hypothetical protein